MSSKLLEHKDKDGSIRVRLPFTHYLYKRLFEYRLDKKQCGNSAYSCIWVKRSVLNWILAGNKLEKGNILIHLDGDKLNDNIENLRSVTINDIYKVLSIYRSGKHHSKSKLSNYPPELNDAIFEMVQFQNRLSNINNKNEENEYGKVD